MDEANVTHIMECIEEGGHYHTLAEVGTKSVIASMAEWRLAIGQSRVALIPLVLEDACGQQASGHAQDECVICFESSVLFPVLDCCSRTNEDCSSVKRICQPCRTKVIKGTKVTTLRPFQVWYGIGKPRCPLCRRNLVTHSKHKQLMRTFHEGGMWVAPIGDKDEWVTETGSIFTASSEKQREAMHQFLGCELIDHPPWKRQRTH